MLDLSGASKRYGEKVVYKTLDFPWSAANVSHWSVKTGSGKSTLLKMLAGVLALDTGTRTVGHGVSVHCFASIRRKP